MVAINNERQYEVGIVEKKWGNENIWISTDKYSQG